MSTPVGPDTACAVCGDTLDALDIIEGQNICPRCVSRETLEDLMLDQATEQDETLADADEATDYPQAEDVTG
jgi:hypothetical protein